MNKKRQYFLLLLLSFFTLLIRIPALTQPLGPDQGIMSVIGQGLLRGEIPYIDNWEMASPAIFFTYALIYKLFGNTMMAVPLADMLVAFIGTLLIFTLGEKLYGGKVGLLSAFLYTLFSNGISIGMNSWGDLTAGTYWYIGQRESFMSPLIILGMIFTLKGMEGNKAIWFGLIGLLGGVLFLYKFPVLLIFIMQLVFLNQIKSFRSKECRVSFFRKNGFAVIGFLIPLVAVVWFFWAKGAFHEMIDATFVYVYSIYGEMKMSYTGIIKTGVIHTLTVAREGLLLWTFAVVSSVYIIANEMEKKNIFIVTWAAVSFLIIVLHREFFGYHYLIIFPPLSILSAYGIQKVFKQRSMFKMAVLRDAKAMILLLALIANMVIYVSLNYKHYTRFLRYYSGHNTIEWYYAHFSAYPRHEYSFPSDYLVSEFIKEHAGTTDKVFVLGGIESVIHVLTGLKSPSRFVYSWFLFTTERSETQIAERYRKELLHDLEKEKPEYIVSVGSLQGYQHFSGIYRFIKDNYELTQTFPDDRHLFSLKTRAVGEDV